MIKTKIQPHETIPPYGSPATKTPMMNGKVGKTNGNFDSPLPPMLNTPGLKMLGSHHHGVRGALAMESPDDVSDDFNSPVPPDLTCTVLLRPGNVSTKNPLLQSSSILLFIKQTRHLSRSRVFMCFLFKLFLIEITCGKERK